MCSNNSFGSRFCGIQMRPLCSSESGHWKDNAAQALNVLKLGENEREQSLVWRTDSSSAHGKKGSFSPEIFLSCLSVALLVHHHFPLCWENIQDRRQSTRNQISCSQASMLDLSSPCLVIKILSPWWDKHHCHPEERQGLSAASYFEEPCLDAVLW